MIKIPLQNFRFVGGIILHHFLRRFKRGGPQQIHNDNARARLGIAFYGLPQRLRIGQMMQDAITEDYLLAGLR